MSYSIKQSRSMINALQQELKEVDHAIQVKSAEITFSETEYKIARDDYLSANKSIETLSFLLDKETIEFNRSCDVAESKITIMENQGHTLESEIAYKTASDDMVLALEKVSHTSDSLEHAKKLSKQMKDILESKKLKWCWNCRERYALISKYKLLIERIDNFKEAENQFIGNDE
jgi:hypothetical protein